MNINNYGLALTSVIAIMTVSGCGQSLKPVGSTVPEALTDTVAADDNLNYYALCAGKDKNLKAILQPIVNNMVLQKIPYSQKPSSDWRDCSGNFLRLSSYVASACPEQQQNLVAPPGIKDYRPGGNNKSPGKAKARTTRAIAKWYQQQGRFTPIYYDGVNSPGEIPDDLHHIRHLVRPGAVLWFSRKRPTSAGGLNSLFNKTGSRTHINHMGTVTSVKRDESGQVINFEMYHGHGTQKKPKLASITTEHHWEWPVIFLRGGKKSYPSFGYWKQYLVGVGSLVPVVSASAAD